MATIAEQGIAEVGETYEPPSTFTSRKHVPALDGLRGVAILAVMLHHFVTMPKLRAFDVPLLLASGAGWVGVELFFALSGFFITGILIDTRGAPRYARTFYARRSLRIVPLYAVAVAVLTLSLPIVARVDPIGAHTFGVVKWWYWTHTTNIMMAIAGRWEVTQLNTAHFWSLALEEQFYLVWPIVVALCPPRRLGRVCIAVAVGSGVLRLVFLAAGASPITIYTLPVTHLDALALGSALAVARRDADTWNRIAPRARALGNIPGPRWWTLAVLGLTVMVLLDHHGREEAAPMQAIGYPLIALAAAALVSASIEAQAGSALYRWLTSKSFRTVGRYSYGLYVLHYPLCYVLAHLGLDVRTMPTVAGSLIPAQFALIAVAGAGSFALAWLSYRYLESPFLKLKRRFPITVMR